METKPARSVCTGAQLRHIRGEWSGDTISRVDRQGDKNEAAFDW